jgi:microcystin synthetase protein McyD
MADDYTLIGFREKDTKTLRTLISGPSALSGRVSYCFGLIGPSISYDTACSSSHVAIHGAINSILNGECEVAIVAGVNVMLSPHRSVAYGEYGLTSPSGRCKVFDETADGLIRGEGCGVVILKKQNLAISDSNKIYANINGVAILHGGKAANFLAPCGTSQEQILKNAIKNAGISVGDIDFIEAHGTGTPLGDLIEIGAISNVFSRREDHPIVMGATKANIGHLEAGSGIAGLIKTILVLMHEEFTPIALFQNMNPKFAPLIYRNSIEFSKYLGIVA